ncbi:uncharacterized protein LOC62_05G007698 [Vanrija pseudolonga]|uniref:Uncharacterized protein n=1 Tax=Vanrija pseudolonga TaxID=143232 RepID=A0AAF1BKN6_9TREE|nr:hypothetical protein LOC62_05G007698 [Vanrija pseudolonga]
MATSTKSDLRQQAPEDIYYTSHTLHPGYARFHRYEDIDYIKTYVDMCLAKIPGMAIIDILSREFTDILGVLTEAIEYSWWRTKKEESRVYRFRKPSDTLDYIVLLIDDVMALPDAQQAAVKAKLQKQIRSHEDALHEGLKYLEQQRASQRVGDQLPAYPGPVRATASTAK